MARWNEKGEPAWLKEIGNGLPGSNAGPRTLWDDEEWKRKLLLRGEVETKEGEGSVGYHGTMWWPDLKEKLDHLLEVGAKHKAKQTEDAEKAHEGAGHSLGWLLDEVAVEMGITWPPSLSPCGLAVYWGLKETSEGGFKKMQLKPQVPRGFNALESAFWLLVGASQQAEPLFAQEPPVVEGYPVADVDLTDGYGNQAPSTSVSAWGSLAKKMSPADCQEVPILAHFFPSVDEDCFTFLPESNVAKFKGSMCYWDEKTKQILAKKPFWVKVACLQGQAEPIKCLGELYRYWAWEWTAPLYNAGKSREAQFAEYVAKWMAKHLYWGATTCEPFCSTLVEKAEQEGKTQKQWAGVAFDLLKYIAQNFKLDAAGQVANYSKYQFFTICQSWVGKTSDQGDKLYIYPFNYDKKSGTYKTGDTKVPTVVGVDHEHCAKAYNSVAEKYLSSKLTGTALNVENWVNELADPAGKRLLPMSLIVG
jgi:hypothetical protein